MADVVDLELSIRALSGVPDDADEYQCRWELAGSRGETLWVRPEGATCAFDADFHIRGVATGATCRLLVYRRSPDGQVSPCSDQTTKLPVPKFTAKRRHTSLAVKGLVNHSLDIALLMRQATPTATGRGQPRDGGTGLVAASFAPSHLGSHRSHGAGRRSRSPSDVSVHSSVSQRAEEEIRLTQQHRSVSQAASEYGEDEFGDPMFRPRQPRSPPSQAASRVSRQRRASVIDPHDEPLYHQGASQSSARINEDHLNVAGMPPAQPLSPSPARPRVAAESRTNDKWTEEELGRLVEQLQLLPAGEVSRQLFREVALDVDPKASDMKINTLYDEFKSRNRTQMVRAIFARVNDPELQFQHIWRYVATKYGVDETGRLPDSEDDIKLSQDMLTYMMDDLFAVFSYRDEDSRKTEVVKAVGSIMEFFEKGKLLPATTGRKIRQWSDRVITKNAFRELMKEPKFTYLKQRIQFLMSSQMDEDVVVLPLCDVSIDFWPTALAPRFCVKRKERGAPSCVIS
eukprot:TRINITY_DN25083_c0_g1_i1.p1 TRINITY_DN25083_c0_g1~~TRINITY_DN25083_c0_g1_i1.p1  ORF type:complete len:514 (+),score=77.39 TRINITY_DN25083_c0_g1_i1:81-1622(+)